MHALSFSCPPTLTNHASFHYLSFFFPLITKSCVSLSIMYHGSMYCTIFMWIFSILDFHYLFQFLLISSSQIEDMIYISLLDLCQVGWLSSVGPTRPNGRMGNETMGYNAPYICDTSIWLIDYHYVLRKINFNFLFYTKEWSFY